MRRARLHLRLQGVAANRPRLRLQAIPMSKPRPHLQVASMNRLRLRSQTTIANRPRLHLRPNSKSLPRMSRAITLPALNIDQVRTTWNELVNAVRAIKPSLAHFLNGATLIGLEGHVLKLGFGEDDRFAMNQVLNNRESVEEIAEAKYGRRLRLEAVAKKDDQPAPQAASQPESDPSSPLGTRHF